MMRHCRYRIIIPVTSHYISHKIRKELFRILFFLSDYKKFFSVYRSVKYSILIYVCDGFMIIYTVFRPCTLVCIFFYYSQLSFSRSLLSLLCYKNLSIILTIISIQVYPFFFGFVTLFFLPFIFFLWISYFWYHSFTFFFFSDPQYHLSYNIFF